ncbi:MAG: chemotaxis protein CheW [Bryobacteraceae bacterium]|nr:chemotaxis protein CheW [Bryobacteraceae bacterium]
MPAPPLRFVIVRLAGRDYGVPAARVCGMMLLRTADLEPAPDNAVAQSYVRLDGRSVPVVEPHGLLGLEPRRAAARSCLLLIRDGARHEAPPADAAFALAVDSISRIEEVPAAFYRPPGRIRLGESWREVLDLDQLQRAALEASASLTTN